MAVYPSTIPEMAFLRSGGWLDDILIRICVALQLTPTQYKDAETHYRSVAKWLAASESPLAAVDQEIFPQGSLRIGTTVRPWWREEYDLDVVLWLALTEVISPLKLLNVVEVRLRDNKIYGPMVERKNRCLRLNFEQQFHMDVLPARPDPIFGGTHVLVPDRAARCWKPSNPKGFALWFEDQGHLMHRRALQEKRADIEALPLPDEARDKNSLQLAVQLLKRWRDIRFANEPELAPISIVLTTLAGTHYRGEPQPFDALVAIVRSIRLCIPSSGRLIVCNPSNPREDLSERWAANPEAYRRFVRAISELDDQLGALRSAEGMPAQTARLNALFGEKITRIALNEQAKVIESSRHSNKLAITPAGGLTLVTTRGSVPVKRNSFYGE